MPDVQEVFRMATQKVRRDPGAMERHIARQQKAARNRRIGAFATVAVLVAAVVAVFTLTRPQTQTTPVGPVSPSITTSVRLGTAGSMLDIGTSQVTRLPASIASAGTFYAVSPDHTQVAFNACCAAPGPVRIADIDGTHVHQVTAKGWDAYGAQWSPDGSTLVYQQRLGATGALGNLFVLDVATGRRTQLTNFDQTARWYRWWFTFPSFAPDGRSILFQLPRGNPTDPTWDLRSVPVTGGKETLVRRNAAWGGYSPDGTRLAYLTPVRAEDFSGIGLWITSVSGGTPRALVRNGSLAWVRWSPDGKRLSYWNNGAVYVTDVATGTTTKVAPGGNPEWFDDHTLILGNPSD
jgi:dipeptidyl aminopeptidase/acylaminoacyl peptidase